jgi:hypothetical protein
MTMTITLTADIEKGLVEQAGKRGTSPEALAMETLRSRFAPPAADRTRQQLEALGQLCRKLDAMPTAPTGDGLTNRDHDRILYGA